MHRTQYPLLHFVEWAKQCHLYDDIVLFSLTNAIFKPGKVGTVPPGQIEFVPATAITRLVGSFPRRSVSVRSGSEFVFFNVEGTLRFYIHAREYPRQIQVL